MSRGVGTCTVRSKLNKFEHVWGWARVLTEGDRSWGPVEWKPAQQNERKTQLKTLPSRNFDKDFFIIRHQFDLQFYSQPNSKQAKFLKGSEEHSLFFSLSDIGFKNWNYRQMAFHEINNLKFTNFNNARRVITEENLNTRDGRHSRGASKISGDTKYLLHFTGIHVTTLTSGRVQQGRQCLNKMSFL